MQKSQILFPGSFDPFTLGHLDLIERALRMFDKVHVLVADNSQKKGLFSPEEKVALIAEECRSLKGVSVSSFSGLTVEFARIHHYLFILRGLRSAFDTNEEFRIAEAGAKLNPGVETVFLKSRQEHTHISSTLVKEIARYHGNLAGFVGPSVRKALAAKFT